MGKRSAAYSAMLFAVVIWGVNFHVVKLATTEMPNHFFTYLAIRFWVAALAYYCVYLFRNNIFGERYSVGASETHDTQLGGLTNISAFVVACCLILFYSLQTESIRRDSPVNAAFLTATFVLWVPLIRRVITKKSVTRSVATGIGITLIGLLVLEKIDPEKVSWADVLGLLGAFALAVEVFVLGEVTRGANSLRLLLWTGKYTLIIAIVFTAAAAINGEYGSPIVLSKKAIFALLFTGLAATAIANFLANWANSVCDQNGEQIITSVHRAILENLDAPIALAVGVLLAWSFEIREPHQYVGCILIITGVLTAELGLLDHRNSNPPAPEPSTQITE
jgi:drug/metabolite transporter (DMT)-like permease